MCVSFNLLSVCLYIVRLARTWVWGGWGPVGVGGDGLGWGGMGCIGGDLPDCQTITIYPYDVPFFSYRANIERSRALLKFLVQGGQLLKLLGFE